jgi:hypothetical protein
LVPYFFARHTSIDCWDKRGLKGYLFTMGDELPYDVVHKAHVNQFIGEKIEADIPIKDIVAEVSERYHYFHLLVKQGSNFTPGQTDKLWRELLGERCLVLDQPENVAEMIALTIGVNENAIDIDTGLTHLEEHGLDAKAAKAMSKALVPLVAAGAMTKAGKASGLSAPTTGGVTRV